MSLIRDNEWIPQSRTGECRLENSKFNYLIDYFFIALKCNVTVVESLIYNTRFANLLIEETRELEVMAALLEGINKYLSIKAGNEFGWSPAKNIPDLRDLKPGKSWNYRSNILGLGIDHSRSEKFYLHLGHHDFPAKNWLTFYFKEDQVKRELVCLSNGEFFDFNHFGFGRDIENLIEMFLRNVKITVQ